jgi:hypothetical protein
LRPLSPCIQDRIFQKPDGDDKSASFDNMAMREWAKGLGVDTFATKGGKSVSRE